MRNLFDQVPLMFQAQIGGRAQLQRIDPNRDEQDSQIWVDQWIDRAYDKIPEFGADVRSRIYEFSWRFVTNSGQDPTIIRPAMGAFGLPFYPGSSMKGVFLRACKKAHPDKIELYCGSAEQPGILRFHGGYPTNDWKKQLLDITHPQQGWQVKEHDTSDKPSGESGFALISLYQPTFQFGISSNDLDRTDWDEVWEIWEKALASGLGCRTSSGYGEVSFRIDNEGKEHRIPLEGEILFRGKLKGQGQTSKLLDGTPEFRPNIFRAAIRGHALRIFGGITNEAAADKIVNDLFGSTDGKGNVGKLAMNFQRSSLESGEFGYYQQPTYIVKGELIWISTSDLLPEQKKILQRLIDGLSRFAMIFGGFGNSWRRVDHRKFFYDDYDKLIGCHWEWTGLRHLERDLNFSNIRYISKFINQVRQLARDWQEVVREELELQANPQDFADWREDWYPDNVQIWGRIADGAEDSEAIKWFHEPYQRANRQFNEAMQTIKTTSVTGFVGRNGGTQIGKSWHRMYPLVRKVKDEKTGKDTFIRNGRYLELLTIFPDRSPESRQFIEFLQRNAGDESLFQKLWSIDE